MTDADKIRQALGHTVRALRRARGWSQEDVAGYLGFYGYDMHQVTVARIESGSRPTSVDELHALASVFRIDPRDLIRTPKTTDAEEVVAEALLLVQVIKAKIREINLQIDELTREKKLLGQERSEALKAYHAARKAANMPSFAEKLNEVAADSQDEDD